MTISVRALAQELELVQANLVHLAQEVASIHRSIKLVERHQDTLDMILKRT